MKDISAVEVVLSAGISLFFRWNMAQSRFSIASVNAYNTNHHPYK